MMEMERKILRALRENGVAEGSDLTVALSGGADSVALLAGLRELAPSMGLCLRAAHFHHGLRGEEADRDAEFCRVLCDGWQIPFTLGRADAAREAAATGHSLEEAARDLRYAFLYETAPGLIATAHNADDNAETLLMHLIRGTGLRGLGGIPPRRDRLVRPLLGCTRAEILAYLQAKGLSHVEDSTNHSDDCLRNRLRHRILPLLRQENPSLTGTLCRTAALLRQEDDYLSEQAARAEAACRQGEGYDCARLRALEPVLRRRIWMSRLQALGLEDPAGVYVEALERLLRSDKPSARLDLPGGKVARREYGQLLFSLPPLQPVPETELRIPGVTVLPDRLGILTCFVTKNSNFSQKKHTIFPMRYDMISQRTLKVRSRRPGDRLHLAGGTKSLKELMIDRKIPALRRNRLPVLTVDGRIAAVVGVGMDPDFAPSGDETVLLIRFSPEEQPLEE